MATSEQIEGMKEAARAVLEERVDEGRYVDMKRIPLICAAIITLQQDVADIKGNIAWGVRIVIGAVIMALLAMLYKS